MTDGLKGMETALVGFAQTGKLDFKSLIDSMIADLIRFQIRAAILGPLSKSFASLFSGDGTGTGVGDAGGLETGLFGTFGGDTGGGGFSFEAAGARHGGVFQVPGGYGTVVTRAR